MGINLNDLFQDKSFEAIRSLIGSNRENTDALMNLLGELVGLEDKISLLQGEIDKQNSIINDSKKTQKQKDTAQKKSDLIEAKRLKLEETRNRKEAIFNEFSKIGYNRAKNNYSEALDIRERDNFISSKGKSGNKADIISMGINMIGDLVAGITTNRMRRSQEIWKAEQDINLKNIETSSKVLQQQMTVYGSGINKALTSSLLSITQGVQESAYSAANSSLEFSKDMVKMQLDTMFDIMKLRNYENIRNKEKELEVSKLDYELANTVTSTIKTIGSFGGPLTRGVTGFIDAITSTATKIMQASNEIEVEKLKIQLQLTEEQFKRFKEVVGTQLELSMTNVKTLLDFTNQIETLAKKSEEDINTILNLYGYDKTKQSRFYDEQSRLSFKDKNGEVIYLANNSKDRLYNRENYTEKTGRNYDYDIYDENKLFLISEVLGDKNLTLELTSGLDYFNRNISDSSDVLFEMYQNANKVGISNKKFSKELVNNLKIAEKYTFKGGVNSLMKMSIWAQSTRFNMESLASMIDKVQEGGLEGVIKQGAQLQVLGGNVAMGADPLGMMYEAWNDPEGYAKRMQRMTRGLGRFNSTTGEVEIKGQDAMMVSAIAKAQGRSVEDIRKEITQRIKGEEVERYLNEDIKKNFNKEQIELITNKAQRNKDGSWFVTIDGVKTDVNDLNNESINSLLPHEEKIEFYVGELYNMKKKEQGVTNHIQSRAINKTKDNIEDNSKKRREIDLNWFNNSEGKIVEGLIKTNNFVTAESERQKNNMLATLDIIDKQFDLMATYTEEWANSVRNNLFMWENLIKGARASSLYAATHDRKYLNEADTRFSIFYNSATGKDDNVYSMLQTAKQARKDNYDPNYVNTIEKKLHDKVINEFTIENKNKFIAPSDNTIPKLDLKNISPKGGIISDVEKEITDRYIKPNDNKNIYMSGEEVKPINDGMVTVAKSHPNDKAIFAKEGGPFDTLFNGVFAKVNKIYDNVIKNNNITPIELPFTSIPISKNYEAIEERPTNNKKENIDININGKIELTGGGQNVNITDLIKSDPLFIRRLTELIIDQIGSNKNGGKTTMFRNRYSR